MGEVRTPAAAGALRWPPDGRARAESLEFGAEPVVRTDVHTRRLNNFIGALNVLEAFSRR